MKVEPKQSTNDVYPGEKVLAVLKVERKKSQSGNWQISAQTVVVEDRAKSIPQGRKGNVGMTLFDNFPLVAAAMFRLEGLFFAASIPSKDTDDADFMDWLSDRLTAPGIYFVCDVGTKPKYGEPDVKQAAIKAWKGLAFPEYTPAVALAEQEKEDKAKEAQADYTMPVPRVEAKQRGWTKTVNDALDRMEQRAAAGGGGGRAASGGGQQGGGGGYSGGSSGAAPKRSEEEDMLGGGGSNLDEVPF